MFWGSTYTSNGAGELAFVVLLAFLIDIALGDPRWLYHYLPHPVAAIGKLIGELERRLNRPVRGRSSLIWRGAALSITLIVLGVLLAWVIENLASRLPGGQYLLAVIASIFIAYRGLHDHVLAVSRGLRESLQAARVAVAKIVGRDPDQLDGPGIARAAVESLAENFSDAVVAPLFWFLLLGLPGLVAYKMINTLDSMIGHSSARYEAFGKFAAKLDDAANWLPARLSGFLIIAAALFLPGADPKRALSVLLRDAPKHRSPNAGWQEAAFAGALGYSLAGPRRYRDETVEDSWMGDGRRDLGSVDVERAITLYRISGLLVLVILLAVVIYYR